MLRILAALLLAANPAAARIPTPEAAAMRVYVDDGRILRLGPVVRAGPRSGFHDPVVGDDETMRELVEHAFRNGALVSNGHNSLWNRIPEAENAEARRRILECAARR